MGAVWQSRLTQTQGQRVVQIAEGHLVVVHLPVLLTLRRGGAIWDGIHYVLHPTTSSTSFSSVVQAGTHPHSSDQ